MIRCGTGAATVPFAQAVGEHGRVVGVDISEPMLAGARKRIAESGLGNVSLIEADAQFHPFEPDRFDLITSRFGVMFFADPVAAFRNVLPAARPGGRLCFACWAPLDQAAEQNPARAGNRIPKLVLCSVRDAALGHSKISFGAARWGWPTCSVAAQRGFIAGYP